MNAAHEYFVTESTKHLAGILDSLEKLTKQFQHVNIEEMIAKRETGDDDDVLKLLVSTHQALQQLHTNLKQTEMLALILNIFSGTDLNEIAPDA